MLDPTELAKSWRCFMENVGEFCEPCDCGPTFDAFCEYLCQAQSHEEWVEVAPTGWLPFATPDDLKAQIDAPSLLEAFNAQLRDAGSQSYLSAHWLPG